MKKIFFVFIGTVMITLNVMHAINNNETKSPDVIVLNTDTEKDHLKEATILTFKYVSSLNFAGKEKIKKQALEKFKAFAKAKGYTYLEIDEKASYKRQNEIRKRNYTVHLVGLAFK